MGRLRDATPPPGALDDLLARLEVEQHAHVPDWQVRRVDEEAVKWSLWADDEKHELTLELECLDQ